MTRDRRTFGRPITHPVVVVVCGSLLVRLGDLVLFALVAHRDGVSVPRLLRAWDGEWLYRAVAEGWPATVPVDPSGAVQPSTWAWPPGFPLLVRVLASPFGRDAISPTMILINLLASVGAAVLLWAALRATAGNSLAVIGALLWASMPASPVFLMAYAEGLFMLLLFAAIVLAGRGHLAASGGILVVAGLTKSSVAPYALALAIVSIIALRRARRRTDGGSSRRDAWAAVVLSLVAVAVWPVITAVRLGSIDAYARVQQPWSRRSIPVWDSVQLLWNAGTRPYEDPLVALVLVTIALVAGLAIVRDQRFPLMVRRVRHQPGLSRDRGSRHLHRSTPAPRCCSSRLVGATFRFRDRAGGFCECGDHRASCMSLPMDRLLRFYRYRSSPAVTSTSATSALG